MRRLVVVLLAITGLLVAAAVPAYATINAGAGTNKSAPCSKAWNYDRYGATASAHADYLGTRGNTHLHLQSGKGSVSDMIDCGPGGYTVNAARITLSVVFTMTGTSLSGCSAGYPAGFYCTATSTTEKTTYNATCTNAHSCSHTFADLDWYAGPGGNYNNWYIQTNVTFARSDGNSFSFGTSRIGTEGF